MVCFNWGIGQVYMMCSIYMMCFILYFLIWGDEYSVFYLYLELYSVLYLGFSLYLG